MKFDNLWFVYYYTNHNQQKVCIIMNDQCINGIVQQLLDLYQDSMTVRPNGNIEIETQDFGNVILYPTERKIQFEAKTFDMADATYNLLQSITNNKSAKRKKRIKTEIVVAIIAALIALGIYGTKTYNANRANPPKSEKVAKHTGDRYRGVANEYKQIRDSINHTIHSNTNINQQ